MKEKFTLGSARKQLISVTVLIVMIAATYLVLGQVFDGLDFEKLCGKIKEINVFWIIPTFALGFLYVFFEGCSIADIASSAGPRVGRMRGTVYAAADIYFAAITPSAAGGQPAAVYYMSKDGGGVSRATMTMLVNTFHYTLSLIVMALAVMLFKPHMVFSGAPEFKVLFAVGMFLNLLLLGLCLACMFSQRTVRRVGVWFIGLVSRIRIFKNREEKIAAFDRLLEEYRECVAYIKGNPWVNLRSLGFNIVQRMAIFSIAYLVYRSFGFNSYTYFDLISIQTLTAVAVNSLPLPGAVGAAEGMFAVLYRTVYTHDTMMPAMMLTRGISYYLCFLVCGIVSVCKHIAVSRSAEKYGGKTEKC